MPSLVTLQNGENVRADEDAQALAARFDVARRDGTLLLVSGPDSDVWVNPHALATIRTPPSRQAQLD